jgi:hypothetical protein
MKILFVLSLLVAMVQATTNMNDMAASLAKLETEITKPGNQINWGQFGAFFLAYPTPPTEAALRERWFTLSTRYANQFDIIVMKQGRRDVYTKPAIQHGVGRLGLPFETVMTIEGVRTEKGKVGTQTLTVNIVNGIKVEKPITIWIDNVEHPGLPEAKRCVLKGYETGKWIGGDPNQQASRQFFHEFVVTEVIEPATLKIEKKSQPTHTDDGNLRAR